MHKGVPEVRDLPKSFLPSQRAVGATRAGMDEEAQSGQWDGEAGEMQVQMFLLSSGGAWRLNASDECLKTQPVLEGKRAQERYCGLAHKENTSREARGQPTGPALCESPVQPHSKPAHSPKLGQM